MDIITAKIHNKSNYFRGHEMKSAALAVTLFCTTFASVELYADPWKFEPSIEVSTIFSDNIERTNNGDSDTVLELAPGIKINRDSRRLKMNLDYRLQNLTYSDDSDRDQTNHRLSANLNAEALTDTFFIDVSTSVSQQLADRKSSGDNISGAGLDDVSSYSISPYWQERLGNFAEWELRYTYDMVSSDQSNNDSDGKGVSFSLVNGPATGRLSWNVDYEQQKTDYDDGDSSDTETASARINYRFLRTLSGVISGTYEDFEFIGDRGNSDPDDSYVGAGLTWVPSPDFSATVLYNDRLDPDPGEDGEFVSADLYWSPTARTDVNLSYGNSFFGDTYNGALTHRTRWTRWNLSYDEGTSDFRSTILEVNLIACPATAVTLAECDNFSTATTWARNSCSARPSVVTCCRRIGRFVNVPVLSK